MSTSKWEQKRSTCIKYEQFYWIVVLYMHLTSSTMMSLRVTSVEMKPLQLVSNVLADGTGYIPLERHPHVAQCSEDEGF